MVVVRLASDNNVVLEDANLSPDSCLRAGSLGKSAKVTELATQDNLIGDFVNL